MNNELQNNYRDATNQIGFSGDFNEKTISRLRAESGKVLNVKSNRRSRIMKICAAVAAVMLVLGGTAGFAIHNKVSLTLPNSTGISAHYSVIPHSQIKSADCIVYLSESEIIKMSDLIAAGTVTGIRNITVSFGVGSNEYWSIVTFKPESILKGDAAADEISFLVHCQLSDREVWATGNDVIEKLKTGDRAIFMLKKYDATSIREENGNTLYYTDLCEYGLPNGIQFAVIETDDGLAFGQDIFGFDSTTTFEQAVNHFSGIIG